MSSTGPHWDQYSTARHHVRERRPLGRLLRYYQRVDFLEQHKSTNEIFSLPSGEEVSIPKYILEFKEWKGVPISNTYNGKAVIDWKGEPVFAEIVVLRLFQSHGWNGVWADSYRRKYRVGLPDVVDPIELPEKQKELIDSIRSKTGRFGGCWDLLLWKGNDILFIELKRRKKDHIQASQTEWLATALELGLDTGNFALVEWSLPTHQN